MSQQRIVQTTTTTTRYQSSANPFCHSPNPRPICQSNVNLGPMYRPLCQSLTNRRPTSQFSVNTLPIRQYINLPILDQTANPSPIHQFMSTQTTFAHHQGTGEILQNTYKSNNIPDWPPIGKKRANSGPIGEQLRM